jgi:hypothetical protein
VDKDDRAFDELLAFACGEIDADFASRFAEHVRADVVLASRLERVRSVVACLRSHHQRLPSTASLLRAYRIAERAAAAPPGWLAGLTIRKAWLVYDSRAQPAWGLRGPGENVSYQLAFEGDLADLDLELQRVAAGRWRLTGQVDARAGFSVDEVAIAPAGADGPIKRVVPNARGVFWLELDSAKYDLVARTGENAQLIQDLELD